MIEFTIKATTGKLSPRKRFEVLKRDRFVCRYCGAGPPDAVLNVDHVVPIAEGGTDEPHNLVTACQLCNFGKGAVPLDRNDDEAYKKRENYQTQIMFKARKLPQPRERSEDRRKDHEAYRAAVAGLRAGNITRQDLADACSASLPSIHQALCSPAASNWRNPPRNWQRDIARLLRNRAERESKLADQLEKGGNVEEGKG